MTDTPNLALPYILAAQAQKHVTHNEALRALDCIVQLAVVSRALSSPPLSPASGSRYIVATGATGEWVGRDGQIAAYQDGAWAYFAPREGWLAWVTGENVLVIYAADTWAELPGGGGEGGVSDHGLLSGLGDDDHPQYHNDARGDVRYMSLAPTEVGINATADSTNRLAMKSPASLFDNDGAGHQQKINKTTTGDTASQLYQTNYSGRAEIGLTGDDDFHFKVSSDGSTWKDALKIDKTTGLVTSPYTPAITLQKFTSSGTWTRPEACKLIKVTVVGGGGAGGGAQGSSGQASFGGGGGAGGFSIKWIDATSLTTETVTIGAKGTGVSAGTGSNGGSSSFGSHCSATGGIGGARQGTGTSVLLIGTQNTGLGSGGDINGGGTPGNPGFRASGTSSNSGGGGNGLFGGGGGWRLSNGDGANAAGVGGGGAGANATDGNNYTGGNGADGIVVVEEYY